MLLVAFFFFFLKINIRYASIIGYWKAGDSIEGLKGHFCMSRNSFGVREVKADYCKDHWRYIHELNSQLCFFLHMADPLM